MELIVFATKNILNKKIILKLKNNYSKIIFIKKNEVNNFNYNKNTNEKVIFIDPYFFDWKLPKNLFKNIKNIKCVCVTTTTASFIDEEYLRQNKIKLLTTFNYSTQSVAEYLIFMMFCLAKNCHCKLKMVACRSIARNYYKQSYVASVLALLDLARLVKGFVS